MFASELIALLDAMVGLFSDVRVRFQSLYSDMVFATGCIGRMILRVYIVSVHLSPTWCLLLNALAGSVSSSMLSFLDIYICLLRSVSCWVPWTNHFAVGVLGFARGFGCMILAA